MAGCQYRLSFFVIQMKRMAPAMVIRNGMADSWLKKVIPSLWRTTKRATPIIIRAKLQYLRTDFI